jgi:hypothetical protein
VSFEAGGRPAARSSSFLHLQNTRCIFSSDMNTPAPIGAPDAAAVLTKAVLNAARMLGLRHRELAAVLGASEASISRLHTNRLIEPESKEGELALLLLRLFRSLDALVGGEESKARAWLNSDNTHLGGIPAKRIRRVEGLVDVVQYLDSMRGRL